ncbi:hypothetical protein LN042_27195 [Kitasatospora sp. RB6PN24]|uniref:hypothetical protein n=1 Tax=Kitasatospora humi TaxID=2893891 RepID=UPI001E4AA459|nr:hypothetical protein [Kitasatospora humi]MCC9310713.1 hypothetical protein [Kitasatospora humi]
MSAELEFGPVEVQLCNSAKPVTFAHLTAALAGVREGLDLLPLSKTEHRWLLATLTSSEARAWATENLEGHGIWVVPYQIGAIANELIIRPMDGSSDKREEEQPPSEDPGALTDPR